MFECHIRGDPRPKVEWFKKGLLLVHNERYVMKHEEDGTCQLIIFGPQKYNDSGRYICRATNRAGEEECLHYMWFRGKDEEDNSAAEYRRTQKMIKSRHVHYKDEDDWEKELYHSKRNEKKEEYDRRYKLTWITKITDKVIPQGSTLKFFAFVDGKYPQFDWYRDDIPLAHGRKYNHVVRKDGKGCLLIYNAQIEDSGTYKLVAKNYANSIESTAKVTVYDCPYTNFEPPLFLNNILGTGAVSRVSNLRHCCSVDFPFDVFLFFFTEF